MNPAMSHCKHQSRQVFGYPELQVALLLLLYLKSIWLDQMQSLAGPGTLYWRE
jgi:hypothetical protein